MTFPSVTDMYVCSVTNGLQGATNLCSTPDETGCNGMDVICVVNTPEYGRSTPEGGVLGGSDARIGMGVTRLVLLLPTLISFDPPSVVT